MKKKLLLASLISLSCINMANATCTPPTSLKCNCQHPIINSEGKLACGEDYCAKNGKKCMPDGSCCEADKYCEVSKECCSENETCDTTSGCVEATDFSSLCNEYTTNGNNLGGDIVSANGKEFCLSWEEMPYSYAVSFCETNGMRLAAIDEMCPNFNETGRCFEMAGTSSFCWGWSSTLVSSETDDTGLAAYAVDLSDGWELDVVDITPNNHCAVCVSK